MGHAARAILLVVSGALAVGAFACATPSPATQPATHDTSPGATHGASHRATDPAAKPAAPGNRDPKGPPDVESYIARLEHSGRESYLPTKRLVELLRLGGAEHVADLGCGPGVVTVELSRAVPAGRVYAVDLEPAQLDRVNRRIDAEALRNVVPVLCVVDDARLAPASVDCIVVVDTYHHFDDRVAYLRRVAGALRPGGRVVNVDFKDGELPVGPPVAHRIPRARMLAEFAEAGFVVEREETEFAYHDYVVFVRGDPPPR